MTLREKVEALAKECDFAGLRDVATRIYAILSEPEEPGFREALARLVDAAEVYSADQKYANDKRCGLVQPITLAEGQELNDAIAHARILLNAPAHSPDGGLREVMEKLADR
jgi:hypothetical protein